VNWDDIDTAKARYFGSLQSDWSERVRCAQEAGRPGDILTLAENAPTRVHESTILYEAAIALIDLCRYEAAERVLDKVINMAPNHLEAQLEYARVLIRLNHTDEAEAKLKKITEHQDSAPKAVDLSGQAYRHRWHLSWRSAPPSDRKKRAIENQWDATLAIERFVAAHKSDPKLCFAGFNALMLDFVWREIGGPGGTVASITSRDDLTTVVRYTATNRLADAQAAGNYNDRFWCTTTLAGIDFMSGNADGALAKIKEACSIHAPTTFQLQTFQARLQLIHELAVGGSFVGQALEIVDRALNAKRGTCGCERVFVWSASSSLVGGQVPDVPPSDVEWLGPQIEEILKGDGVSRKDLGICAGMTESDVVFAEVCVRLGVRIRVMQRGPVGKEAGDPSWPFKSETWQRRWEAVTSPGDHKEIWRDDEYLGPIIEGVGGETAESVASRRHRQWLINTVEMEAETTLNGDTANRRSLYGLVLWDEQTDDNDSAQRELIQRIQARRGEVRRICLGPNATVSSA
jgi:tetratricopeptide (TPR) repeat protein